MPILVLVSANERLLLPRYHRHMKRQVQVHFLENLCTALHLDIAFTSFLGGNNVVVKLSCSAQLGF